MAETSTRPRVRKLPKPYAQWNRKIEDARTMLEALQRQDLAGSRDTMANGCLSFVVTTIWEVETGYSVRHGKDEGLLQYHLLYAHSIASLAEQLLQPRYGAFVGLRPALSPRDEVVVHRLCRMGMDVCAQMLKWLPKEAAERKRLETARKRKAARALPQNSAAAGPVPAPGPRQISGDLQDTACPGDATAPRDGLAIVETDPLTGAAIAQI
jgi:hypothetical protein